MASFLTDEPKPQTDYVSMDEPCVMLFEFEKYGRRHRHIWVIRDDAGAEYRKDIGPADGARQILLSGGEPEDGTDGIVETVGSLIDCANDIKLHPFETEGIVKTDLAGAYHDRADQQRLVAEGKVL